MHSTVLYSVAAFAAAAAGLQIITPTRGEDLDFSKANEVTWDSVRTDPSTFSIVVVDNTHYPPVSKTIADNVDTSKGSYTIPPQPGLENGSGYQINLVSKVPQNEGILAQSEQFNAVGSNSGPNDQSNSNTASTTGAPWTPSLSITATVSGAPFPTGSSSWVGTGTGTGTGTSFIPSFTLTTLSTSDSLSSGLSTSTSTTTSFTSNSLSASDSLATSTRSTTRTTSETTTDTTESATDTTSATPTADAAAAVLPGVGSLGIGAVVMGVLAVV